MLKQFHKDSRQTLVCTGINHSRECPGEVSSRFSVPSPYFHLCPLHLQCLLAHSYFGSCIPKLTNLRVSRMAQWGKEACIQARVQFLGVMQWHERIRSQVVLWFPQECHAMSAGHAYAGVSVCTHPQPAPKPHTLFFTYVCVCGGRSLYIDFWNV